MAFRRRRSRGRFRSRSRSRFKRGKRARKVVAFNPLARRF